MWRLSTFGEGWGRALDPLPKSDDPNYESSSRHFLVVFGEGRVLIGVGILRRPRLGGKTSQRQFALSDKRGE